MRLTPTKAHRMLPDGSEELVDAHALRPGDVVRVRPGDNIPADGVIVSGGSTINQANITGESLPVDKTAGDEVFGGTTNLTGALQVKVTEGRARHDAGPRAGADPPGRANEDSAHAADRPLRRLVHPGHADAGRRRVVLHARHDGHDLPAGGRLPVRPDPGDADGDGGGACPPPPGWAFSSRMSATWNGPGS